MNIKLENINEHPEFFDFAIETIFAEWGDNNIEHLNKKKEKLRNQPNQNCYVLVIDNNPIGCFVIRDGDINGHPELSPNLACVCIDKQHRGKGYSKVLMKEAIKAFKLLGVKKAYLKTTLVNFYEKFGWEYLKEMVIDGTRERIYTAEF